MLTYCIFIEITIHLVRDEMFHEDVKQHIKHNIYGYNLQLTSVCEPWNSSTHLVLSKEVWWILSYTNGAHTLFFINIWCACSLFCRWVFTSMISWHNQTININFSVDMNNFYFNIGLDKMGIGQWQRAFHMHKSHHDSEK